MKLKTGLRGSRQQPKARTKVEPAAADTVVSLSKRAALVGREKEIGTIRDHIRRRKSLHIHGPMGAGKSALLDHHYKNWDAIDASCVPIYCKNGVNLREILVCITEALFERSGPLAGTDKYLEPIEICSVSDIRTNSNRDLRNMIFPRVEQGDYCVILDHLEHITQGMNAFLYSLHERACVITASRQSWDISDLTSVAGSLAYDLWLVPKLRVENLHKDDAFILMDLLFGSLNKKVRDKPRLFKDIYEVSQGNPKMIKNILQKAADPKYLRGGKLNLNLIVIDCQIDEVRIP
jgi:hypothetical protein